MRRFRSTAAALALAPLAVTWLAAPAVNGGVVPVSRSSTITHFSDVSAAVIQERRTGDAFGRYVDRIDAGDDGFTEQDTTFELSTLGELLAFGRISTFARDDDEPDGTVTSFVSGFDFTFDVIDRSEPYALTGAFVNSIPRVGTAGITLTESDSGDVVFRVGNGGFPDSTETNPTFDESGVLAPGRYTLSGDSNAPAAGDGEDNVSSADFAFSAGDAAVIPLPPAVWAAAPGLLLAAAAAARNARPRRRRA